MAKRANLLTAAVFGRRVCKTVKELRAEQPKDIRKKTRKHFLHKILSNGGKLCSAIKLHALLTGDRTPDLSAIGVLRETATGSIFSLTIVYHPNDYQLKQLHNVA